MSSKGKESTGRYEFQDEHNHKFWEGEIKGKAVTLHFGKAGTSGLRASREFASEKSATEFLERRLQQKIEEGYKLVVTDSMP